MKNQLIALALILVAGLTAPAHAAKGEGTLVQTALKNLQPKLAEAEKAGFTLDEGASVVGLYVAPGKSYDLGRTWRRPADKFRVAIGKTAGDAMVNGAALVGENLVGFALPMDANSVDQHKGILSEDKETGNARWTVTFTNNSRKPIYFVIGFLRANAPLNYPSSSISKAFEPLFEVLESSNRKLPLGTHSLGFAISVPNKAWDWTTNLKKGMLLAVNNDESAADLTVAVLAKNKSVIVPAQPGNPAGINVEADQPGGTVRILNQGTLPVLSAFLYL